MPNILDQLFDKIRERTVNKFKRLFISLKRLRFKAWLSSRYREKEFSFISQNCIGGRFYELMGSRYLSPTVGLWFEPNDFLLFCEDLEKSLSSEIIFDKADSEARGYPVGIVNGAKILFLHYDTFDRAKERWLERVGRIRKEKVVILMTDRDGFNDAHKERYIALPFARKILFSHLPAKVSDPIIYVPGFEDAEFVGELYGNYEYFDNSHVKRALAKML